MNAAVDAVAQNSEESCSGSLSSDRQNNNEIKQAKRPLWIAVKLVIYRTPSTDVRDIVNSLKNTFSLMKVSFIRFFVEIIRETFAY